MEQQVNKNPEEVKVQGNKGEQEGVPAIFTTLSNQIANNHQSLYSKLVRVFLKNYSEQEREKIEQLLEAWNTYDLDDLMQNEDFVGEEIMHFYKQIDILSARTYRKLLYYIKKKRTDRDDSESDKKWEPLRQICWQNEIQFSLDRYFWSRKFIKKSGISYSKQGFQKEQVQQVKNNSQAKMVADWIAICQVPLLKNILQFMKDAHFFVLQGPVENIFMQKLQRISSKDQKELFIKSISCDCYEDAKVLHTKQFKSADHQKEALQAVRNHLKNYFFYKDGGHEPRSINSLHSKFKNYQFLENRHDYIQWMFPNHYGSAFNSKSFQLTYLESSLFQQDAEIGLRMLFSIYLFFDFMGIRLHFPNLKLSVCSRQRLQAVILVNYHNHLRIMRVLACLSVTGFRPIALSLIDLLDKLTAPTEFLHAQRHQFESSWSIYGDNIDGGPKKTAKNMCFLEQQSFPKDHNILSLLGAAWKQENHIQVQGVSIIQDFA